MGGRPKGLEEVGGARIIDRVVSAITPVTEDVALVANNEKAHYWLSNVALLGDIHKQAGGLAGVHAAIATGRNALVVAWDMPFVSAALLRLLTDRAISYDADVVVPESESPYGFEPFCAFYSARVLQQLDRFLATGGGAARDFLAELPGVHRIPVDEVRKLGEPRRLFFSVNTDEDLAKARAMAAQAE